MSRSQGKLERLRGKESELLAQIKLLDQKEKSEKRKHDTRKKILIGCAFMKAVDSGQINESDFLQIVNLNTTNIKDRELLDLPRSTT